MYCLVHRARTHVVSCVKPHCQHIPYVTTAAVSCAWRLSLKGDCTKAKKELGWVPEITFQELVKDMMKSDIANVDAGNDHA